MTNMKNTSLIMQDFAHTDRRSARANIEGRSVRAFAFTAFEMASAMVARKHKAADDFEAISFFAYKHHGKIKAVVAAVKEVVSAVVGITVGAALYIAIFG